MSSIVKDLELLNQAIIKYFPSIAIVVDLSENESVGSVKRWI